MRKSVELVRNTLKRKRFSNIILIIDSQFVTQIGTNIIQCTIKWSLQIKKCKANTNCFFFLNVPKYASNLLMWLTTQINTNVGQGRTIKELKKCVANFIQMRCFSSRLWKESFVVFDLIITLGNAKK